MTDSNDIPEVGPAQMDAILRFLPIFEQPEYSCGEWDLREGVMPYYVVGREVMEFVQTLYNEGIVFSFNWGEWTEEAQKYISEPERLETAELLTLRKLLTTHVRADRFNEGHLGEMLENGHITAVLKRLQEIRDQYGQNAPAK